VIDLVAIGYDNDEWDHIVLFGLMRQYNKGIKCWFQLLRSTDGAWLFRREGGRAWVPFSYSQEYEAAYRRWLMSEIILGD
jgi:hypothetical protein